MLTAKQAASRIAGAIHEVYERRFPYGHNPGEVETMLWTLHSCWTMICESSDDFNLLFSEMLKREGAMSGLWANYKRHNPDATFDEGFQYVVKNWKAISMELKISLDATVD